MLTESICCNCHWYEGVNAVPGTAPCSKHNKQVLWNEDCDEIWLIPERLKIKKENHYGGNMKNKVLHNVYETTCSRCHRKFQVNRYIHRLEIHQLDMDDFRPWSTLSIDLCFQCMNAVKEFIFGKDEEDTYLEESDGNRKWEDRKE